MSDPTSKPLGGYCEAHNALWYGSSGCNQCASERAPAELTETPRSFDAALADVRREAERVSRLWPPYNSAHEGYAVLIEEVDELKEHVWKHPRTRDLVAMRREAIQVAAVAVRIATEVCNEEAVRR